MREVAVSYLSARVEPRMGAHLSGTMVGMMAMYRSNIGIYGVTRMSGAECLADMLEGYGVTHVFHVPAVLRKTFAVMETRTGIKRLHVHGEKAAAYMADGYARASGKP